MASRGCSEDGAGAGRTLVFLRDSGKNCALLPKLRDIYTLGDLDRGWRSEDRRVVPAKVRSTHRGVTAKMSWRWRRDYDGKGRGIVRGFCFFSL